MLSSIRITAPAKLNLSLRVGKRREDGFHDIESLFQRISLADELVVSVRGKECQCIVECPAFDLPEVNTISSAVSEFRKLTGITCGIHVKLNKHIPDGAGLGGGSSDAAAVLKGLDCLCGTRLSRADMLCAGAAVGSDVPFFLSGPCAVVTGRGERLADVKPRGDLFFLLICPEVRSQTKEAYRLLDEWTAALRTENFIWPSVDELAGLYGLPVRQWRFANSFTPVLAEVYPVIQQALEDISSAGSLFTEMTGSGSAVFGLFDSWEEAERQHQRLSYKWKRCLLVRSLDS